MIKNIFAALLIVLAITAKAKQAPKPYGLVPTARQIDWQETEMYCIIHFSMATFADKEWGYGDEDNSTFNPTSFSAMRIVSAAKAGGFKGIIVVAKHHDGFCLWPTKTTKHNISNSPYKNGKGDILKEYRLACDKLGMKMGVYCSPWDRNNAAYGTPAYLKLYRQQLKELYTNYGPLFMSWHDGANGGDGFYGGARQVRKINRSTYYDWDNTWAITRKMQPGAAIFGDVGPDVRWVGNENGFAGETSWETYTPLSPEADKKPANGFVLDRFGTEGTRNGKFWMPAECDVALRPGWFYHAKEDGKSKSAETLMDLYFKSVGRAACLDLGLSPDKRGRLSDEDVAILKQFGNRLKQIFATNLIKGATINAINVRNGDNKSYGTANLMDNDRYSYWATDDRMHYPQLIIDLQKPKTFNIIRLRENIKLGQRVEGVYIDMQQGNGDNASWVEIASATSIGANRLIKLDHDVTATKLRIRITASPVGVALSDIGLFEQQVY